MANTTFTRPKFPIALPNLRFIVPHRVRRKWRATRSHIHSRITPASSIARLQTSVNPADTLRSLREHQWSFYDGQYFFLAVVGIFSLCVMEVPGPMLKTFIATLILSALMLPVTRQVVLPFLPVIIWLLLFAACKYIPGDYRPPIWVRVLPALENILYGANLSNIISAHKSTLLDILGWLPYGIIHFASPVITVMAMWLFGPPGTAPTFARCFGYMNLTGVIIQLILPCSPPWYENMYGLAPANYSMPGSPAGLAAIDKLFGLDMYTSTFTASPMVFGAFPSLHAGWATLEALFLSHLFPRLMPVGAFYVMWLWWATMYLSHHYAVDLVAGSLLAGIAFFIAKTNFLPRVQSDKSFRFDYDYIEIGEDNQSYPYGTGPGLYKEFQPAGDSDEWTIGSSSSVSSRTRSPSTGTGGARSPVDEHGNSLWEGDTLASSSDHEQYR
ncbi:PAP2-domain-containing protein [Aulographum hederae CBS 113979]|uniref:PAP2-domain-containing protein n=1 Tax=Aulographum hederae CBS 113979 TaxID=1176131 RepID=A0A6G1GXY7_9PEZI|nr:PAP2-domain-containing protein [Aulographum hederae CBS 113979]